MNILRMMKVRVPPQPRPLSQMWEGEMGMNFVVSVCNLSYDPETSVLFVFISVSLSIYILLSVYSEMPVFMCMCTYGHRCAHMNIYISGLLTEKPLKQAP